MDPYQYWNDISVEKQKAYWIDNVKDLRIVRFLREETNLERCFLDGFVFADKLRAVKGRILDVGAGVAWTSAIVSRKSEVSRVTALDFSEHRLKKIAPLVFSQFIGDFGKFEPVVGDLMDSKFPDESFDVVIFCQALYHFADLKKVMENVKRLLVPGGMVIVSCERIVPQDEGFFEELKKRLRWMIKGRADKSGNHFWKDAEYRQGIMGAGFEYSFQALDYPVYPKSCAILAGNHFGIKK